MERPLDRLVADGAGELDTTAAASHGAVISGTMLADIVRCERRVHLDLHGDAEARAEVSGFVQMLWRQGSRHEELIVAGLPGPVADLRDLPHDGRMAATVAAMDGGADWILGGRLVLDDMEGRPDLLHRIHGVWTAGDVKSGSAWEANGVTPRLEYAVQVGFYARLLEGLRLGAGERAFVIGSDATVAWYDLGKPSGRDGRTLSSTVDALVRDARGIRDGARVTRPALSSACGLCVWRSVCKDRLRQDDDLTLIPGLGRAMRTRIETVARSVAELADLDVHSVALPGGRTSIGGVGVTRLSTFRERARVLATSAPPFAVRDLGLARRDLEHHLDLETDPTCREGDFTYLHGVWRRRRTADGEVTDYVHFLAEDFSSERDAFAAAVRFLTAEPSALLTTFSAFERSTYRRLALRYPDVIDVEGVDAMFGPADCVDLYFDAALPSTHWPVNSLGLKSLARHLGFDWSASDASGAASIQWFVEWTRTRDPALLERILTYNRDDCIASAVVFDGLLALPVMAGLPWPNSGGSR